MKPGVSLYLLLIAVALGQTPIPDGESALGQVDSVRGGELLFAFNLTEKAPHADLVFSVTTFSDWAEPDLYLSGDHPPTEHSYEYSAIMWGAAEVEVPASYLRNHTVYYLLARCPTYCRFLATARYRGPVLLRAGEAVKTTLRAGASSSLLFTSGNHFTVSAVPTGLKRQFDMKVEGESGQWPASESWFLGWVCTVEPTYEQSFTVVITAKAAVEIIVTVEEKAGIRELIASVPTEGSVAPEQWTLYKFFVADATETVYVMRTVYTGFHDIYIRASSPPTVDDYSLKATKQGTETLPLSPPQRRNYGAVTGWYFVGVLGHAQSTYLLTVSVNRDSFLQLFQGISHSGIVAPREVFYFYLELPIAETLNVTVAVHATNGSPQVFVQLCTLALSSSECQLPPGAIQRPEAYPSVRYSGDPRGNQQISFQHSDSLCYNTVCRYAIAVRGRDEGGSAFVIVATYEDSAEYLLRDGFPLQLSLPAPAQRRFRYQVADPRVLRLSFHLTVLSGQCALCVSSADFSQCEKHSDNSSLPDHRVEYVRGVDAVTVDSAYFITVFAKTEAVFSLLARETLPDLNTTIALFPGLAQRDAIVKGDEYRFYRFQLAYTNSTKEPIDVRLTPVTGRFHIYVSNTQSSYNPESRVFYFNWSSEAAKDVEASVHIHIPTDDPAYLPASTYEILVLVSEWMDADSAEYLIWYESGQGLITLVEGIRQQDEVEEGQYRFYMIEMEAEEADVLITVEATYGDPDLYVSTSAQWPKPTIAHHSFNHSTYGGESLSFPWGEAHVALCMQGKRFCVLYVSVYGYTQAGYSILVRVKKDLRVVVEHGSETRGRLESGEYAFFYSPLDASKPAKLVLQAVSGEATLYSFIANDLTGSLIRAENAAESAESSASPGFITIKQTQYPVACHRVRCYFDFSVLCRSPTCEYIVLVLQGEERELIEGKPTVWECSAYEMEYFRFYLSRKVSTLVLTLTAISAGDPDLYVSRWKRPTIDEFDMSATAWKSDILEIKNNGSELRGEYYVGVFCDNNLTFAISLAVDSKGLTDLSSGKPQFGSLSPGGVAYYYYKNVHEGAVTISLTPETGYVWLFVSTHDDYLEDIFDKLPNDTSHNWSGRTSGGQYYLSISPSDRHYCVLCNYVIAVQSPSQTSSFTVMVRSAAQTATLANGVPVRISVQEKSTHFFMYQLLHSVELDIALTVYAGEAELYVGTTPLITAETATWTSTESEGVAHIRVSPSHKRYVLGWYYIRIETPAAAHVTLIAHTRDSYSTLIDGWPQTYSIAFSPQDRLMFQYRANNQTAYCRLTPLTALMTPSVYVTYSDLTDALEHPPGPRYNHYALKEYDRLQALTFTLPRPGFGQFSIGVYGVRRDNVTSDKLGDFQFYCVSGNGTVVTAVGQTQFGVLDVLIPYRQYEITVIESGLLSVSIVPCSGELQLSLLEAFENLQQKRLDDGRIVGQVQVAPGRVQARVAALRPAQLDRGVSFQLLAELQTASRPQSLRLYPGNQGLIQWDPDSPSSARVSWSPVEDAQGDPYLPGTVRYYVYGTYLPSVLMSTTCGMHVAESQDKAWQLTAELLGVNSTTVSVRAGQTLVVNVMGVAGSEDDPDVQRVAYRPIEIQVSDHSYTRLLYRYALVAGGMVVTLLLLLAWLYSKFRTQAKANLILKDLAAPTVVTYDFGGRLRSVQRMDSEAEGMRETSGRLIRSSDAS